MRLLAIGDGVAPTGLARALQSILLNLPRQDYDIHHLAINYRGDPHDLPWPVYPAGAMGDPFGFNRVEKMAAILQPEVIVVFSDPWVIERYLKVFKSLKASPKIIPLVLLESDGIDDGWFSDYDQVERVVAVNPYAKALIETAAPSLQGRVEVIPLGVDRQKFFPPPDGLPAAKRKLSLDPDGFVILNANRNQPRKRIDLTLAAFRIFAEGKPGNVQLFLHMGIADVGWNVLKLARRYGIEDRIVMSSTGGEIPDCSDVDLNTIYQACEVGVNTAALEGWGLVAFEHALAGGAQVMADIPSLRPAWSESAVMAPTDKTLVAEHVLFNEYLVDESKLAGILNRLYEAHKYRRSVSAACRANALKPEYDWSTIGEQWDALLRSVA